MLALDVDGVLLDPTRGGAGGWQQVAEERLGVRARDLQTAFFDPWWPRVVRGRVPVEAALAAALETLGRPAGVEELLGCWFEADFWPDPVALSAARSWAGAGARLVLATNQEHRRAAYVTERLGRLLPLEGVACSADLGCTKSEPAFFDRAGARLGLGPAPVVLVDDEPAHVAAARAAGWGAVHFGPGWSGALERAVARAAGGV